MRVDHAAAVFVVFAFVAAGCDSDTPGGDASSRCESAPKVATEFLDVVLSPGMTLGDAVAVRSTDDDSVYIIAANVGGQPAVWFASVDNDAGVVWSVNQHAVDVSEVGKAQTGGSISDDDVEAALSCLP